MVLNFTVHQISLEDFPKHRLLSPTSRISDSVGLGLVLRICISNEFLSDAHEAGLVPTLQEPSN